MKLAALLAAESLFLAAFRIFAQISFLFEDKAQGQS
jgi:hypothetical protein